MKIINKLILITGLALLASSLATPQIIDAQVRQPDAPTGLHAGYRPEFKYIQLSWNPANFNGVGYGYRVYRDGALFATVNPPKEFYNDYAISTDGVTYTYQVSAVQAAGTSASAGLEGAKSSPAYITTNSASSSGGVSGKPNSPKSLTASLDSNNKVKLDWLAPDPTTSPVKFYVAFRGTEPNKEDQNRVVCGTNNASTTTCTDTTAAAGTKYYYKVAAVNDVGTGNLSNEASATTAAPTNSGTSSDSSSNNSGSNSGSTSASEPNPTERASQITKALLDAVTDGNASKVFLWAIGIGAILAFGVITYSGVIWSLSGMSEEKSHAKEWIKGAIQGLLLLIVAYVLLRVINPQLVTF